MYIFLISILVVVCISVIFFVLIQSGKGGGLIDNFSSAESIFGTKTNKYLLLITSICTALFFILTISITYFSKERSKSLLDRQKSKSITETKSEEPQRDSTVSQQKPEVADDKTKDVQRESTQVPAQQ